METPASPNSSCTNLGWTFFWNRREAHVWRRSWKLICGRSARFRSGTNDRGRRFEGLMRSPLSPANTSPESSYSVALREDSGPAAGQPAEAILAALKCGLWRFLQIDFREFSFHALR